LWVRAAGADFAVRPMGACGDLETADVGGDAPTAAERTRTSPPSSAEATTFQPSRPPTTTPDVPTFVPGEIKLRRRFPMEYPESERTRNARTVACRARVFIDERGITERVVVEGCADAFREAVIASLMQWTWYPARNEGGHPTKGQFLMNVKFKLCGRRRSCPPE